MAGPRLRRASVLGSRAAPPASGRLRAAAVTAVAGLVAVWLRASSCAFAPPAPLSRRQLLALAPLVPLLEAPAHAADKAPWTADIPGSEQEWTVTRNQPTSVMLQREELFEAEKRGNSVKVSVVRLPLSNGDTSNAATVAKLAEGFDSPKRDQYSKEQIGELLQLAYQRPEVKQSRNWLEVKPLQEVKEYYDKNNLRYVVFSYETRDCRGAILRQRDNALECSGTLSVPRRHVTVATVQPTLFSSRTGFERVEEDGSGGAPLKRVYEAFWSLDASTPVQNVGEASVQADIAKLTSTFQVAKVAPQVGFTDDLS